MMVTSLEKIAFVVLLLLLLLLTFLFSVRLLPEGVNFISLLKTTGFCFLDPLVHACFCKSLSLALGLLYPSTSWPFSELFFWKFLQIDFFKIKDSCMDLLI